MRAPRSCRLSRVLPEASWKRSFPGNAHLLGARASWERHLLGAPASWERHLLGAPAPGSARFLGAPPPGSARFLGAPASWERPLPGSARLLGAPASWERPGFLGARASSPRRQSPPSAPTRAGSPRSQEAGHTPFPGNRPDTAPRRGLEARDPGKPAIHPSRETGRAPARPRGHRMPRRAEAPPRQAFLYSDQKSFHSSRLCCTGMSR